MYSKLCLFLCFFTHSCTVISQDCPLFPVIDLGYAKHAPTRTNTTSTNIEYATYANIRFAQPPVGNLRFRKPQTPPPRNATLQDGRVPRNSTDCLNVVPPGLAIAPGVEGTNWGSEDCLFLDVKVPAGLQGGRAPVLVWFFGGGYFFGSKEAWAGEPAALFQQMTDDKKFIVVSVNYRLGVLGWLSPDDNEVDKNIGLYDALTGLEWVRDYIGYFGGDPGDITIIGESAGGGIGQHLVTGYGGQKKLPIKKVRLNSFLFFIVSISADMTDSCSRPSLHRLGFDHILLARTISIINTTCFSTLRTALIWRVFARYLRRTLLKQTLSFCLITISRWVGLVQASELAVPFLMAT